MLVQAFAHTKEETFSAMNMIFNHNKDKVQKFLVRETKSIKENYYRLQDLITIEEVMKDLDQYFDADKDNIGVYYNDGETIFISIFKNAKFDFAAYS